MIMKEQRNQPPPTADKFEVMMIVMSSGHDLQLLKSPIGSMLNMNMEFLKRVKELGGMMHQVMLTPVICDPPEAASRKVS